MGIFPWDISHGGYCPVGICPGVFVQGVYALIPFATDIDVRKQISKRCNRIEHWVHIRCASFSLAQYTDTWTCQLHKESRLTIHTYITLTRPPWPNPPNHCPPNTTATHTVTRHTLPLFLQD